VACPRAVGANALWGFDGSQYGRMARPPSARLQANARLDAQVVAMHAASKSSYGRPRIVCGLRELGLQVGHERVRRSLQRQALRPVYKRP